MFVQTVYGAQGKHNGEGSLAAPVQGQMMGNPEIESLEPGRLSRLLDP
jgi:hypothetical protein